TAEAVKAVIRASRGDHDPRQKAVAIENTHNRGGGSSWPLAQLEAVAEVARAAGLAVHLDGARIWNAHVATGIPLPQWCAKADTVSVCLSKGLGAPAGSLVATSRERMKAVRRLRKRVGGGLRQAGVLAAAGMYALDHHLQRLAEDHESARKLAESVPFSWHAPETNILLADVANAPALVDAAKKEGVLINAVSGTRIRAVREQSRDPMEALGAIGKLTEPSLVVLKDFHPFLDSAAVVRGMRELAQDLKSTFTTVILLAPVLTIPVELEKEVSVLDVPLPSFRDLYQLLKEIVTVVRRGNKARVELT